MGYAIQFGPFFILGTRLGTRLGARQATRKWRQKKKETSPEMTVREETAKPSSFILFHFFPFIFFFHSIFFFFFVGSNKTINAAVPKNLFPSLNPSNLNHNKKRWNQTSWFLWNPPSTQHSNDCNKSWIDGNEGTGQQSRINWANE